MPQMSCGQTLISGQVESGIEARSRLDGMTEEVGDRCLRHGPGRAHYQGGTGFWAFSLKLSSASSDNALTRHESFLILGPHKSSEVLNMEFPWCTVDFCVSLGNELRKIKD